MDEGRNDTGPAGRRVWIFHGDGFRYASGVFDDEAAGLQWVARHGLTGILSEYEVGCGCYDLAIEQGRFQKSTPHHGSADHVAGFSPGLGHAHVRDGQRDA